VNDFIPWAGNSNPGMPRPTRMSSPALPSSTRITTEARVSYGPAEESPAGCRVRLFIPGRGVEWCGLLGGHAGKHRIVLWVEDPEAAP
jgi:hypothetical protein